MKTATAPELLPLFLRWGFRLAAPGAALLLLVLLWPVLREQRSRPICVQNLRQLGQAFALYAADNDGVWPNEGAWRAHRVSPHPLSGCPLVPGKGGEGIPGYACNEAMRRRLASSQIVYPERTIAVCEEPASIVYTSEANPYQSYPAEVVEFERGWERHAGCGYYLFFDGHVERLKQNQVVYGDLEMGNAGVTASFAIESKVQVRERAVREFGERP